MLMLKMQRLLLCLVLLLGAKTAGAASIVLNGDFETNSASATQFNMSNAAFDATVANATAFSTAQEIDLVTGLDFGVAPQSGDWKLGLHTQTNGNFDAFSLGLSTGVIGGTSYDLQFYGALLGQFGAQPGPIEIGLSNSATAFGTLIFSGTPTSTNAWTAFSSNFIAPVSGSFLTVRSGSVLDEYVFIDNVSLGPGNGTGTPVPEPTSWLLLGTGLLATRLRRRFSKRS
jgi:hypothetical protein